MEQYSILAKALDEVVSQDINDYLATVDFSIKHEFSAKYKRRMAKLIKRREKPYYKLICTTGRRVACIAVAVVLVLCFAMSFESVRAAVKQFFTRVFSDHIVMEVDPEVAEDYPDTIEEVYEITELPDGFVLVDSGVYSTCVYADYVFEDYYVDFLQETYGRFHALADNQNLESETYIGENNRKYYIQYHESGELRIVWIYDGYIFSVDSNLDKEAVLYLCKSIKMK